MDREPTIRLVPDWPRLRQPVAKKLGKTEDEVQAMADGQDSLDQVELTMAAEEVLAGLHNSSCKVDLAGMPV